MKTVVVAAILACVGSLASAVAADLWLDGRIAIFGSFAGLQYILNPGIAWGIRLPEGIQEGAILIALAAVAWMARSAKTTLARISFGLVIGGGLANVIDRFRDGFVTDYFQVGTFPVFNVADSFVTIGVGMLLVETLLRKKY